MNEHDAETSVPRTDQEIAAAVDAKIAAAVEAAVARGDVSEEAPITVAIGEDGSIHVFNESEESVSSPDPVEFPPMYADESRESETDRYDAHLSTHWGF